MREKKRFVKVTRDGASCIMGEQELVAEMEVFWNDETPGDKVELEIVEMTEAEKEALPEFTGW